MSTFNPQDIFDAAQGGALEPQDNSNGFHSELHSIQDELKLQWKAGTAGDGAVAVVPSHAGDSGNAETLEPVQNRLEKIRPFPRPEIIYTSELKVGTNSLLSTGDRFIVTEDSTILKAKDGSLFTFSNGEAKFIPGTMQFKQSTVDGVTTLHYANGDVVKYNKDGILAINRGFDSVTFQEKRPETPADKLNRAVDKLTLDLNKDERRAVMDMAKALMTGDTFTLSTIASDYHNHPDAMVRIINTLNKALEAADIPRLSASFTSTVDNTSGRSNTMSVTLMHGDWKNSPYTTINFNTSDGGKPSTTAHYATPFKLITTKPASVGMQVQNHIADPSSSLPPAKAKRVF